MDAESPSTAPFIVVSSYEYFLEVAIKSGLAPLGTRFLTEYHGEDIRGHHVITDEISLAMASYATAVTIIRIDLPEELKTSKASGPLLLQYASPGVTYWVQGSSAVVSAIYGGGITPLALTMAKALKAHPEFLGDTPDTMESLAEELDRLMWGERHAGEETEKMLLRMLAAERDRRFALESINLSRSFQSPLQEKG